MEIKLDEEKMYYKDLEKSLKELNKGTKSEWHLKRRGKKLFAQN